MGFHSVSVLAAALNEEEGIAYILDVLGKGRAIVKAIMRMNSGSGCLISIGANGLSISKSVERAAYEA